MSASSGATQLYAADRQSDDKARTESYSVATAPAPAPKPDAVAVPIPAPDEPPFKFWALLSEVHVMIISLAGYRLFFLKYLGFQLVRLAAALSFLVVGYVMGDEVGYLPLSI